MKLIHPKFNKFTKKIIHKLQTRPTVNTSVQIGISDKQMWTDEKQKIDPSNRSVRYTLRNFITNLYNLLSCQLLTTFVNYSQSRSTDVRRHIAD